MKISFVGGRLKRGVSLFFIVLASTIITAFIGKGIAISLPPEPQWKVREGSWSSIGGLTMLQKFPTSGLLVSPEKIAKGSINTTIILPCYKRGCKAHVAYAFRPDYKNFLTAGLGGADAAYSMGEYSTDTGWKKLYASSEKEVALSSQSVYRLKLTLAAGLAVLEINNVKVGELSVAKNATASPMGIWVEGCEGAEFVDTKVYGN